MEVSAPPIERRLLPVSAPSRLQARSEALLSWLITFALTTYLALSGGGYDVVVRSEVGIVVWWLVLLGIIIGVLPRPRVGLRMLGPALLLLAFLGWTWLAMGWTGNQEQTLLEVGRVATYCGVLILGICLLGRQPPRAYLYGIATGIALVSALAVLSKLAPSLFPRDPTARFYATTRLRYPFDYSDGVGEFAAIGVPLLLYVATSARTIWGRAIGAGALPVTLLCVAMTVSRGGILGGAVGLIVFFALAPDRLPRLLTGAVTGVGTLVLFLALLHRRGLTDQLFGAAPANQRHSMLILVIVVCVAVGVIQAALAVVGLRYKRPGWTRVGARPARVIGVIVAGVVAIGVVAFFASGAAHHLWVQFKEPSAPARSSTYARLLSVAGSHRYQYWQVAVHAFNSAPFKGIGPGNFQFYWSQHQTLGEHVLNAHSLWIETLAELGIIGLVLLAGFFLWTLVGGAVRALRSGYAGRSLLVAGVAGVASFCAAAAFDWAWQMGVIGVVAMLLSAICLWGETGQREAAPRRMRLPVRVALGLVALAALWAILVPLGTTVEVRRSQTEAQRGNFSAALTSADDAQELEPEAATPRLQRALVLEQLGDIAGAASAIKGAEERAPTAWQMWFVGSRIATEQDRPHLALRDYLRARSLNPTSPIFKP